MQIVLAYDKLDDIRHLFQEYTAMLVETDETVKACLTGGYTASAATTGGS